MKRKQLGDKLCRIVTFLVCLLPTFSAVSQNVFDSNNVSGKYVITDYLNHQIVLDIKKANTINYEGLPQGSGTITSGGRKLIGHWNLTDCDNKLFLAFNTYDDIEFG